MRMCLTCQNCVAKVNEFTSPLLSCTRSGPCKYIYLMAPIVGFPVDVSTFWALPSEVRSFILNGESSNV